MKAANVSLVVPEELQKDYNVKESGIELLTVGAFIKQVQRQAIA
jgi:hypothetical protein